MKKKIIVFIVCLVLISVIIYVGNIYYPLRSSVCGSGLFGLTFIGTIIGVMLIGTLLLNFRKSNRFKTLCPHCSVEMAKEWVMCPYCGLERREDDLQ